VYYQHGGIAHVNLLYFQDYQLNTILVYGSIPQVYRTQCDYPQHIPNRKIRFLGIFNLPLHQNQYDNKFLLLLQDILVEDQLHQVQIMNLL